MSFWVCNPVLTTIHEKAEPVQRFYANSAPANRFLVGGAGPDRHPRRGDAAQEASGNRCFLVVSNSSICALFGFLVFVVTYLPALCAGRHSWCASRSSHPN